MKLGLFENKMKDLDGPSQNLDFNLIEMVWHTLKQAQGMEKHHY